MVVLSAVTDVGLGPSLALSGAVLGFFRPRQATRQIPGPWSTEEPLMGAVAMAAFYGGLGLGLDAILSMDPSPTP